MQTNEFQRSELQKCWLPIKVIEKLFFRKISKNYYFSAVKNMFLFHCFKPRGKIFKTERLLSKKLLQHVSGIFQTLGHFSAQNSEFYDGNLGFS